MDIHAFIDKHALILVAIVLLLFAARAMRARVPLVALMRLALGLVGVGLVAALVQSRPLTAVVIAVFAGAGTFAHWWWRFTEPERKAARDRLARGRSAQRKHVSAPRHP